MIDNFGFIHEEVEIKILILFIMRRLPDPVTLEGLTALAMCDDRISYFDLSECVARLVRTEHLMFEKGTYSLTEKGIRNGEITEKNIPFSVREKAEEATARYRSESNRNAMIKTQTNTDVKGGCTVSMSLSDGVGEIISMELLAANEKQAAALEKGFRKNAEKIYQSLIEMMTKR